METRLFHGLYFMKLGHPNGILHLFHCTSALCKQVVELKSLITVHLLTVIKLLLLDLDSLSCAPEELLLRPGNEAKCVCFRELHFKSHF